MKQITAAPRPEFPAIFRYTSTTEDAGDILSPEVNQAFFRSGLDGQLFLENFLTNSKKVPND
jgi:hypothetical protein